MIVLVLGKGKTGSLVAQVARERGHGVRVLDVTENRGASALNGPNLAGVDVVIDFTNADAALENMRAVLALGRSIVVGTTGWYAHLADMKALEIKRLDVRGQTDIADYMIIASGTSDRHVRSVAQRVVDRAKEAGFRPHGVEGLKDGDWVLIDLSDLIVHVMLPRVREFYGLEKLWDMTASKRAAARA